MDYKIHVNDTGEEEDYLLVIILDNKYRTDTTFALSRTEKNATQIRLIKSALDKVKFLNDTKFKEKSEKVLKSELKKLVKKANKSVNK